MGWRAAPLDEKTISVCEQVSDQGKPQPTPTPSSPPPHAVVEQRWTDFQMTCPAPGLEGLDSAATRRVSESTCPGQSLAAWGFPTAPDCPPPLLLSSQGE